MVGKYCRVYATTPTAATCDYDDAVFYDSVVIADDYDGERGVIV